MSDKKIFIVIILGIAWFVFLFAYKRIIRKQSFRDRKPMTFEEIYNAYVKNYDIRYETFIEVFKALGNSYSVNPQLIRPTDHLKIFFDIDSWDLDAGTDKINDWLVKTLKIENPNKEIKTVSDLLILVETIRKTESPK